ncbi:GyrI-like domain-containing protein [Clostridium oryzae]|nr:GyrI-like domain-containing protein [Clostridium oryzae]
MEYEIVNLEEKIIVGLSARTNNMAPDMGIVIGGLWQQFYSNSVYEAVQNKKNDKALGIYTDYAGNEKDDYTVIVACEVTDAEAIPEGAVKGTIPTGKYAKFIVKGDMHKAVAAFWQQLWNMNLPRNFICDFEEYQNSDMENAEIHIYIGLK